MCSLTQRYSKIISLYVRTLRTGRKRAKLTKAKTRGNVTHTNLVDAVRNHAKLISLRGVGVMLCMQNYCRRQ